MSDETKDAAATPDQPVDAAVVAVGDDAGVEAVAGIAVQGNQALVVAQFADMDSAKNAYYALVDAEVKRALDIDGVLVANADYQGKVNIQKMTDHKTRNGFLWGAVGGAVIGLIFPPTIVAGAVYAGVAGAAIGKARNVMMKSGVADELAGVIAPGTSGIVALVSLTAVDAVKATIPDAKVVKSTPVDDETANAVKQAAKTAGDFGGRLSGPAPAGYRRGPRGAGSVRSNWSCPAGKSRVPAALAGTCFIRSDTVHAQAPCLFVPVLAFRWRHRS